MTHADELVDEGMLDHIDELPDDEEEPEYAYTSLSDWVYCWLAQSVERRPRRVDVPTEEYRETRWCARWWRHPEVISRLTGMWHAWETLRQDPTTGMSVWWRDHFDPHWAWLSSANGPMAKCDADQCADPAPPLAVEDPPEYWQAPTH